MSTEYFLYCKKCKERCDFVRRAFPARMNWHNNGTPNEILKFIDKHEAHYDEIIIINEHSDFFYDPKVKDFSSTKNEPKMSQKKD